MGQDAYIMWDTCIGRSWLIDIIISWKYKHFGHVKCYIGLLITVMESAAPQRRGGAQRRGVANVVTGNWTLKAPWIWGCMRRVLMRVASPWDLLHKEAASTWWQQPIERSRCALTLVMLGSTLVPSVSRCLHLETRVQIKFDLYSFQFYIV